MAVKRMVSRFGVTTALVLAVSANARASVGVPVRDIEPRGVGVGSTAAVRPLQPLDASFAPGSGRPFASSSPFNVSIPSEPRLDDNSDAMVHNLAVAGQVVAQVYQDTPPVYDADASTPRYPVTCTKPWGTCGLALQPVPIPDGAVPSPGSDHNMVVVDFDARRAYEFWQARHVNGQWTASWGYVSDIDGEGTGGAVGAGVSRLAGIIRTYEVRAGEIDHALVSAIGNACEAMFRYPATQTDGWSSASDCIPEGARIQLDPTVDVDTLPEITPAEKMVGRALQVYGTYVIDNGGAGAGMSIQFENPSGEPDPYPAVGLSDYWNMPHIPWQRLRVLATWNGG
jgi:hypothetical protein